MILFGEKENIKLKNEIAGQLFGNEISIAKPCFKLLKADFCHSEINEIKTELAEDGEQARDLVSLAELLSFDRQTLN